MITLANGNVVSENAPVGVQSANPSANPSADVTATQQSAGTPDNAGPATQQSAPAEDVAPAIQPPAVSGNDWKNQPAMDTAPSDAAADNNTADYYATHKAAFAKIEAAINGELSLANEVNPNEPVVVKAQNVGLPEEKGEPGYASVIEVGASSAEPIRMNFRIPGLDLVKEDERQAALKRLAYKLEFFANNYQALAQDGNHTPEAVKTKVFNMMSHAKSDANPQGFAPEEIQLLQQSQNFAKDRSKTDSVYIWSNGGFGSDPKSMVANFTFDAGGDARAAKVKANIEARAEGIKAYFVGRLVQKGLIDQAKAKKLAAELVILPKLENGGISGLKVHMGLPKSTITGATSVNDLDPSALAAISDNNKEVNEAFELAMAFGETPGVTDKELKWPATFDMFGPKPLVHFLADRVTRINSGLPAEAAATLQAEFESLRHENVLEDWAERHHNNVKGKPQIHFHVKDGGKVEMTIAVPEGVERTKMWANIANSPLTALPAVNDPLPPTSDIAAPATGTVMQQNATPPVAEGQTADAQNTATVAQGQTPAADPVAQNSTLQVNTGTPTVPISSTTTALPPGAPSLPQAAAKPVVGAGVWTGATGVGAGAGIGPKGR